MAQARGIRKTTARNVATATPKPKAKPPLATKHETTTELAHAPKGELTEQWSKAMVREAQRLDDKIIKTIDRVEKDVVVLGEMFAEMHDSGYHRALGFGQFPDYLAARYPNRSKSQIFQSMRIVRELTSGPNPAVSKDDIREMSRDNAEGLARMKKQGREITPELIEQAKTLPVYRFAEEVAGTNILDMGQRSAPSASTSELQAEVQVKRVFYIAGTTNSNLDKAIEIIKFKGEGHERDRGQSLDDYIISALVGDFLSAYGADYEEMLRVRNAEAIHAATLTEDRLGPDAAGEDDDEEDDEDEDGDDDSEDEGGEDDDDSLEASGEETTIPICRHIKGDGNRCQSPTVKGGEYCFFHKKHYVHGAATQAATAIQ